MITASFLIVILFLGGWHFWGLTSGIDSSGGNEVTWMVAVLRIIVLLSKVMVMILFFMLVRWSWPRFRYDQLMDIGWKVMIPWGLANVVVVAVWVEYGDRIAASFGLPAWASMSLCGFMVLVLGWYVATKADPTLNDNHPRRRLVMPDQQVEDIEN
jgi:NADH-quinone oxidoreductase subunit H